MASATLTDVLNTDLPWLQGVVEELAESWNEECRNEGVVKKGGFEFDMFTSRIMVGLKLSIGVRFYAKDDNEAHDLWVVIGFEDGIVFLSNGYNRLGKTLSLHAKKTVL